MIRNSYIKIKDEYINLDRVSLIRIIESKGGCTITFCFNGNSDVKFWFDKQQISSFNRVVNSIDKKLITGSAQPTKRNDNKKPSGVEEVIEYFKELKIINPKENAEKFYNYYESNNWYRGKTKIVKWKSCVKTWKLERETDEEDTTFEERLQARKDLRQ